MELYKKFLAERDRATVYYNEFGFVTYSIAPSDFMYFSEFYVVLEKRNTREAYKLWQFILKTAKDNNCSSIIGSVDITTNNWKLSEKLMLKAGFNQSAISGNLKYFIKNI